MSDERRMMPLLLKSETRGNEHLYDCEVPADLAPLEGHFPGFPLVAGVFQLKWVMDFAAIALRRPPRPARLQQVKFQRLLRPGDRFRITIDVREDGFGYRLSGETEAYASGRVVERP